MKSVQQLVAKQVAYYQARQALAREYEQAGHRGQAHPTCGPYLLISRQEGAGAHVIGAAVAQALGWQLFDGEIVDQIAERSQVRRQLIESLDEHSRPLASELVTNAMDRHDIGHSGYLHYLRQVILALGQQGHVVILGRGARYILPPADGLILRLVATMETRVQRVASKYGLDAAAGRTRVIASDRQRANFIHHNFHGVVDDLDHHDLVINTTHFTPEASTHIVLAAVHKKLGTLPNFAAEARELVAAG